ncbi:hypothetical protein MIND_00267500 [Mycena indigotica]|uniref:AAA-ATPase-like domain-containing protein n=1 Tax=Mycena indigotica TaxID=2126181 RepID=A0A8H6T985_9AGAR|nr:uncharacterized protein MIND_00267500 [Mycena indigotica]KAF7312536.1 hypothetical protein MIND_00267500 [Mycena indigotica]
MKTFAIDQFSLAIPPSCKETPSSDGSSDGSEYVSNSQDSPTSPSVPSAQQVPDSNCLAHICGTVYTRGATCQRLPNPHEDFDDIVNSKGAPLVFKRHVLTQLACLLSSHHALVFRRPPGWGIDFFASMVSATFDRDYDHKDDPFEVLIGQQGLTSGRDDGHHSFFVLDMDFRDLPDEADIRTNLHAYLETQCWEFITRYRLEKRMAPPSLYKVSKDEPERFIILLAMCLLRVSRAPLLVIIRNFDSPIINYGEGRAVLNPFLNALEGEVRSRIVGSLLLLSTYDDGTVYSCMGRNALSMIRKVPSLPPPDLPRTLDLTHHLAFQTAVGFTRKEIDSLDDAFSHLAVHDARRIVDMLDAGYARRSSFGDRLNVAGKHQCPRHPLDSPFFQEEDPLAALDTTGGLEGVYGAHLVLRLIAHKTNGVIQRLPCPDEDFDSIVNAIGVPIVFNPHPITQFVRLLDSHHVLLVRRPPGWGLNFFVSMLTAYLDIDYNEDDDPFEILLPSEPSVPRNGLHHYFILHLDFERIPCQSDFRMELHRYLATQCKAMVARHIISSDKPFGFLTLLALCIQEVSQDPLFVIIKNFDSPINDYIDGRQVLNPFLNELEREVRNNAIGGLLLVSTWNDGTVYPCQGRGAFTAMPKYPSYPPLNLPRTLDITHNPAFHAVAGFTRREIESLDNVFKHIPHKESTPLMEIVSQRAGWLSVFSDHLSMRHKCPPVLIEYGRMRIRSKP